MFSEFDLAKLPSVEFANKASLPQTAGIYFAKDEQDRLLYIGQAKNIYKRWLNHHREDQLSKINKKSTVYLSWYECEDNKQVLDDLESHFIDIYSPELNQTKVQQKKITPAEITLRKTLAKISKYVVIFGQDEDSPISKLPTVVLKYEMVYRNPARILRSIFKADNKKGNLRWSFFRRSKTHPVWTTKCNGVCILITSGDGVNSFIQRGTVTFLASIPLLKLSDKDFEEQILQRDLSKSYHPNLEKYEIDPIRLLWSKDLATNGIGEQEIKQLSKQRNQSRIGEGRRRGRQVKVYCSAIGKGRFVIRAYHESIEWFGGYEILGLEEANYSSAFRDLAPRHFKSHKVTVRITEENQTRSLSAPISAESMDEVEKRLDKIRKISPAHRKVRFKQY